MLIGGVVWFDSLAKVFEEDRVELVLERDVLDLWSCVLFLMVSANSVEPEQDLRVYEDVRAASFVGHVRELIEFVLELLVYILLVGKNIQNGLVNV